MSSELIDLTPPTPRDWGWVEWAWLRQMYEPSDPDGFPSPACCAVASCPMIPAVAVRRPTGTTLPGWWQLYCHQHAEARGIAVTANGLVWSPRFRTFHDARAVRR